MLPVKYRIMFKLVVYTFKALHGGGFVPREWLAANSLSPRNSPRWLRLDFQVLSHPRNPRGSRSVSLCSSAGHYIISWGNSFTASWVPWINVSHIPVAWLKDPFASFSGGLSLVDLVFVLTPNAQIWFCLSKSALVFKQASNAKHVRPHLKRAKNVLNGQASTVPARVWPRKVFMKIHVVCVWDF